MTARRGALAEPRTGHHQTLKRDVEQRGGRAPAQARRCAQNNLVHGKTIVSRKEETLILRGRSATLAISGANESAAPQMHIRPPERPALLRFALLALAVVAAALIAVACDKKTNGAPKASPAAPHTQPTRAKIEAATFVGRSSCVACHQHQTQEFLGSDHDRAMELPSEKSVVGAFDGRTVKHHKRESKFYKKGDDYFVFTQGDSGKNEEFKIAYTFGYYPLQQYLVKFPGGRLQALSLAWDARSKAEGGQRWYHLYADEAIHPGDQLFWTKVAQNWNSMCAECHSTQLKKNYRVENDSYQTSYNELDVSCEACHGPASNHVKWAKHRESVPQGADPANTNPYDKLTGKGFGFALRRSDGATWQWNEQQQKPVRTAAGKPVAPGSRVQVETCARCHSRRRKLTEEYVHGKPLLDTHAISLIEDPLYFPDGQIRDEVYVYGSFLQSKMHQSGVECSDCHNPHSTQLLTNGNDLCTRCHKKERYDSKQHHFHDYPVRPKTDNPATGTGKANSSTLGNAQAGTGTACVDCHMVDRTYMGVDDRRDHSFRIPRPDLTVSLKSPNACNDCHDKKPAPWALKHVKQWYGPTRYQGDHYGTAIFAGQERTAGAAAELAAVATDTTQTDIVRASALYHLGAFSSPGNNQIIERASQNDSALIRYGALAGFHRGVHPSNLPAIQKRLADPVRAVRLEAVPLLTRANLKSKVWSEALAEYEQALKLGEDRAENAYNLGNLYRQRGDALLAEQENKSAQESYEISEQAFKRALKLDAQFAPATVNLADLYRATGRDTFGQQLLEEALPRFPDDAGVHEAYGLLLVRQKRLSDAEPILRRALELAPQNPRYAYLLSVLLSTAAREPEALKVLEAHIAANPDDPQLLQELTRLHAKTGNRAAAQRYGERLQRLGGR